MARNAAALYEQGSPARQSWQWQAHCTVMGVFYQSLVTIDDSDGGKATDCKGGEGRAMHGGCAPKM